jgi:hypothetical protein
MNRMAMIREMKECEMNGDGGGGRDKGRVTFLSDLPVHSSSIYPIHPFYPVHLVALIGFEKKR